MLVGRIAQEVLQGTNLVLFLLIQPAVPCLLNRRGVPVIKNRTADHDEFPDEFIGSRPFRVVLKAVPQSPSQASVFTEGLPLWLRQLDAMRSSFAGVLLSSLSS